MDALDQTIAAHYQSQGREAERLFADGGELERVRTWSILTRYLPAPPATIYDVGGAAGVYAFPLAELGYMVHLIDPVPLHLEQARAREAESRVTLASISLGDARRLNVADGAADAVLMLGPLYHLTERTDRLAAFREAHRLLRPRGRVFGAAISRFASLIDGIHLGWFHDPAFREIVRQDLASGQHRNPDDHPGYFTTAYFHHPRELLTEAREADFADAEVLAVEGPLWTGAHFSALWTDETTRAALLTLLEQTAGEETLLGASPHLIVTGVGLGQTAGA